MEPRKNTQLYDRDVSTSFYNERYSKGYMDDWPDVKKQKIREVLLSLNVPKEGMVLDFGCWNGVLTELIGQTLTDWTAYGTDLRSVAVENAKKRYSKRHFFCHEDEDLSSRKFDLVITHHVLEHVYDISAVLQEISGYVKPGGAMLHILPCGNEGSFGHHLARMRKQGINPQQGNRFFFEDEGHVRRMTTEELATVCAKHGFRLNSEFYSGHCFSSIDYFTKNEPKLIPVMTDWSHGVDAASKFRIFVLRLLLVGIAAFRKFSNIFEQIHSDRKSLKEWSVLVFAFPVYLIARGIDRYVTAKSDNEWNTRKLDRRGGEMFLYFVRDQ